MTNRGYLTAAQRITNLGAAVGMTTERVTLQRLNGRWWLLGEPGELVEVPGTEAVEADVQAILVAEKWRGIKHSGFRWRNRVRGKSGRVKRGTE